MAKFTFFTVFAGNFVISARMFEVGKDISPKFYGYLSATYVSKSNPVNCS
jgi:hypothetical protein